jgi:hypothetical protein
MTGDPGLVKLAHDVGSNDLVPFSRDRGSPAPQLILLQQGLEGAAPRLRFKTRTTRMAAIMAHAQEKQNSSCSNGCHP